MFFGFSEMLPVLDHKEQLLGQGYIDHANKRVVYGIKTPAELDIADAEIILNMANPNLPSKYIRCKVVY